MLHCTMYMCLYNGGGFQCAQPNGSAELGHIFQVGVQYGQFAHASIDHWGELIWTQPCKRFANPVECTHRLRNQTKRIFRGKNPKRVSFAHVLTCALLSLLYLLARTTESVGFNHRPSDERNHLTVHLEDSNWTTARLKFEWKLKEDNRRERNQQRLSFGLWGGGGREVEVI